MIGTAVIGFGKTGKAVLDFLLVNAKKGETPIYLYNDTPISDPAQLDAYREAGVNFLVGKEEFNRLEVVKRIILSPGVDGRAPRFDALRGKGIEILSEIELAASYLDLETAPIIAVTGTNGKSTTVSLIHHILTRCGYNSFLTGNIGTPLIAEINSINASDGAVVVLEVSSFQLEEIIAFRPHIGLILNITPDHLDRYNSIDDYFAAKLSLVKNQQEGDFLVFNHDDPLLREKAGKDPGSFGSAQLLLFSHRSAPGISAWIDGDTLHFKLNNGDERISLAGNPLRGFHNLENVMAAVIATRLLGAGASDIGKSLASFTGLPHRMESAGKIGGVEFINDSKATNVDATLKSLSGISEPLVVILGGKDKGGDFTLLAETLQNRARKILLLGDAAPTIRRQLKETDASLEEKMEDTTDFKDAVNRGLELLEADGGVVLLAPGCASFDMFKNFEHRGNVFKETVSELKETLSK